MNPPAGPGRGAPGDATGACLVQAAAIAHRDVAERERECHGAECLDAHFVTGSPRGVDPVEHHPEGGTLVQHA